MTSPLDQAYEFRWYLVRAGKKKYEEEMDDLLKAKVYLDKRIELLSAQRNR